LIQVRALTKSIDTGTHRVDILKGIDLEIPRGQFAAIMGPSGSGKSTLLGLLAGLDTPTSGQVILDGEDITNLGEDDMALLRGRKIGFVFQSYHLISTLTAEENVLLPMELAGAEAGGRDRARELLERVGLGGRSDHYPVQLSGGEQQRVALASGQHHRACRAGAAAGAQSRTGDHHGPGDTRTIAGGKRGPPHRAPRRPCR
jgi:putative ABC transport system ATP-binding protein